MRHQPRCILLMELTDFFTMRSVLIGAGTYGEVYLAYLREAGVDVVGFLDDAPKFENQFVRGVPVLGPVSRLA